MPIKVSMHLALDNRSWSDSFLDTTVSSFADAIPRAINLCKKRIALTGTGCVVRSCVLSQEIKPGTPATTGDSKVVDLTGNGTISGVIRFEDIVVGSEVRPDFTNTSILCRYSNVAGTRRSNRYLAAIPDGIIEMSPSGPSVLKGEKWNDRWISWKKYLIENGWAFWGRKVTGGLTAPQTVLSVIQQGAPPGYWGVVTNTSGPELPAGTKVQLRGFKHRYGTVRKWQGMFVVDSFTTAAGPPATRTTFLRNTQLLDDEDIVQLGTIEGVEYEPVDIEEIDIIKQVSRKRGVGYNRPVGRSKARRNLPAS